MTAIWERIARNNLGLGPGERFMILCDRPETFPADAEVVVVPSTGGHGKEPHPDVWRAAFGSTAIAYLELNGVLDRLLAKNLSSDDERLLETWSREVAPLVPKAILAITHYSTSHTAFRRLLTSAGTRYGSMPLYEPSLLREGGPLDVEVAALAKRSKMLLDSVAGASEINIRTPLGTDLTLMVKGRTFLPDDGDLRKPGSFGNLPAGEIYVAPLENLARGRVALDRNTVLVVKDGRVVEIEGDSGHSIRKTFAEHPEYLFVAELGIGTNDKASNLENVLEAEKISGTVHVAFGDNSSFGGKQQIPYHVDHVLFEPTVLVDGRRIELVP